MRFVVLLLAGAALPLLAQEQAIQRQLIQRQQQSDAFALQLRQSQERLQGAPGDLRFQRGLEARQFSERQRLENVSAMQLLEVKPDAPQELRPYERQKAEDARRPLTAPEKAFPQRTGDEPRPLPAAPRGIVKVIEAPR